MCVCKTESKCATCKADDGAVCLTCATGNSMYTGTTVCVTNPTTITNCEVYETADTCKTCKSGTTASTDKKACNASSSGVKLTAGLTVAAICAYILAWWNWFNWLI